MRCFVSFVPSQIYTDVRLPNSFHFYASQPVPCFFFYCPPVTTPHHIRCVCSTKRLHINRLFNLFSTHQTSAEHISENVYVFFYMTASTFTGRASHWQQKQEGRRYLMQIVMCVCVCSRELYFYMPTSACHHKIYNNIIRCFVNINF